MNRDQALTATLDELRDARAEMDGKRDCSDWRSACVIGGPHPEGWYVVWRQYHEKYLRTNLQWGTGVFGDELPSGWFNTREDAQDALNRAAPYSALPVPHPYPPTLDGADAAVPEGYVWERRDGHWIGWETTGNCARIIRVPDTGDKIADLYALGLACRKAMEEKRG